MIGRGSSALLAAGAVTVLWQGRTLAWGLPAFEAAALMLYAAGALGLTGWAVERGRASWRDAVGAVAMWAVFLATLTAVWVNRDAVSDGVLSFAEEVGLYRPSAVVTSSGEIAITRSRHGVFRIPAVVNGRPQVFMFDTGASAVVLTAETAQELGFSLAKLRFRFPVLTANGRTLAARVTIDRLSIGPIGFRDIPALVAGPGRLHENLLGQTVLDRLDSYEVRGDRLVLRGAKAERDI